MGPELSLLPSLVQKVSSGWCRAASCGAANRIRVFKFSRVFSEFLGVNFGIVRQFRSPMILSAFCVIPSLIILLKSIHFVVSLNMGTSSIGKPVLASNIKNLENILLNKVT